MNVEHAYMIGLILHMEEVYKHRDTGIESKLQQSYYSVPTTLGTGF